MSIEITLFFSVIFGWYDHLKAVRLAQSSDVIGIVSLIAHSASILSTSLAA